MPALPNKRAGVALVVGISDYLGSNRIAPLKFAHRDAVAFAKVLCNPEVGCFPQESVHVMTNRRARRRHLIAELSNWLPQAAKGAEIVVLYFAGHGAVHKAADKKD